MNENQRLRSEPHQVLAGLIDLGRSVRSARIRRRMSAKDFASRIDVSLPTLRKLERGDPGVSWGCFATALWVLDVLGPVQAVIRPENDAFAATLEMARLPKRVRQPKDVDLADL